MTMSHNGSISNKYFSKEEAKETISNSNQNKRKLIYDLEIFCYAK
jgi:hypothetical protein